MARFSLSDLKRFLAVDPDHPYWMGIDVHKNSYHVALRRRDGNVFTWSAPAFPKGLLETITDLKIPIEGVCYESGPTGFTLARVLQSSEISVIVGAASKVPRSVSVGSKTDRLDCIKLAEFASKGLIRPIAIPSEEKEYERSLLRRRTQVVDQIRRCKQRIKSLFLYHGFKEPKEIALWQKCSLQILQSLSLPPNVKSTLNSHVRELEFLQSELTSITKDLKKIIGNTEHRKIMNALTSVPGVGEVVATTFLLEIFDPQRFASYIGLAPRVRHSGEKTPKGHIVSTGQTRLRSLLVEAAWMWRAKDEYAKETYNNLVGRTGIPQKAITALARMHGKQQNARGNLRERAVSEAYDQAFEHRTKSLQTYLRKFRSPR